MELAHRVASDRVGSGMGSRMASEPLSLHVATDFHPQHVRNASSPLGALNLVPLSLVFPET